MTVTMSKLQQAHYLKREAERDENNRRCKEGEAIFFLEHEEALLPGHCYSHMGIREVGISGWCEYHFDSFFPNKDE